MNRYHQLTRYGSNIRDALTAAVAHPYYLVLTVITTVCAFALFMLVSFPAYSGQLLAADIWYIDTAVITLAQNLQHTAGTIGLALMVIYAVLVGATLSVTVISIRTTGLRTAGSITGAVPGILVGGCASCGVGLLSLVGFSGALTLLPFNGNGIRLAGIGIMLIVLAAIGDPRECRI